jgi:hypothetical protein
MYGMDSGDQIGLFIACFVKERIGRVSCITNFCPSAPPIQHPATVKHTFSMPNPEGEIRLEQLVLKGHIVLWLETDTGTEDVGQASALLGEGVHDRCTGRGERSLVFVNTNGSQLIQFYIP